MKSKTKKIIDFFMIAFIIEIAIVLQILFAMIIAIAINSMITSVKAW